MKLFIAAVVCVLLVGDTDGCSSCECKCPSGFYGLNANDSEGCLKCQCSNKSSICASDAGWLVSVITTNLSVFVDNIKVDGWTAVNSGGSSVAVILDWGIPVQLTVKGSMKVDTSGPEDLYFVAPAKYLGDQRFAYTFTLSFKLQQDNASLPAASSRGDVILEGKWFNEPLVTSLTTPPPAGNNFRKYEVKFVESDWKVGNTSGRQPTSYEMIVVLSHLTSLRIRAKWTSLTTRLYSRLGDIVLPISNRTSVITSPENASNVECCSCPPEYTGQFCEQCADGYTRSIPNGGPYVTCVRCQCTNHSETCHPETGICQNGPHNDTAAIQQTTCNFCNNQNVSVIPATPGYTTTPVPVHNTTQPSMYTTTPSDITPTSKSHGEISPPTHEMHATIKSTTGW